MSIIPGIENLAPERTLHQQRVVRVAELAPIFFSRRKTCLAISSSSPAGQPPSM